MKPQTGSHPQESPVQMLTISNQQQQCSQETTRCLKHSVSKSKTTPFSQNQYLLITDVFVNGHNAQYFERKGKTKRKTCSPIRAPVLKFWLHQVSLRKDKIRISAWTYQRHRSMHVIFSILCVHWRHSMWAFGCCLLLGTPSFIPSFLKPSNLYSLFILFVSFLLWLFLLLPYSTVIP